MKRDYAKPPTKSRKKPVKKSRRPYWLIILFIFLGFTGYLIYPNNFNNYHLRYKKLLANIKAFNINRARIDSNSLPENIPAIPRFEFYKIAATSKNLTRIALVYTIEIATLDNYTAVDNLKAELALLGFTANVTSFFHQGSKKYLVSLGPYTAKEHALHNQEQLKMHKITGYLKVIQ